MGGKALANLKKKRSSVKGAITRLDHRLSELEVNSSSPNRIQAATLLLEKIQGLEKDFKGFHEGVIEYIEAEAELEHEQDVLDRQDEYIEGLILRLQFS